MPFAHRRLVDVSREDQLGAGVDEAREHVASSAHRFLARAPRRSDQVVVKDDDPEGARGRFGQTVGGVLELVLADAAGLVTPGTNGVEADDV